MSTKHKNHRSRLWGIGGVLLLCCFAAWRAGAQEPAPEGHAPATTHEAAGAEGHEGGHEKRGLFDPEYGTWLNWLARPIMGPVVGKQLERPELATEPNGQRVVENPSSVRYDVFLIAVLGMLLLGVGSVTLAKKLQLRPGAKVTAASAFEAAVEGYRNYLIGVMGEPLGKKYASLISAFFFTILTFNWLGLIPGLASPTANPNIPIGLSLCAFLCVHFIAIKEAGFKSWIMHFVGEPIWLAWLNFPLHIIGEMIKPLSLSIRLLCNVFGEEMVSAQLIGLALAAMVVLKVPIPFQLPMLFLGLFFGLLQALVYSTLLAIYISILATHHDDHDEHNLHGHTEHVHVHGFDEVVAHPSEMSLA